VVCGSNDIQVDKNGNLKCLSCGKVYDKDELTVVTLSSVDGSAVSSEESQSKKGGYRKKYIKIFAGMVIFGAIAILLRFTLFKDVPEWALRLLRHL
jgi:hypothetical protein